MSFRSASAEPSTTAENFNQHSKSETLASRGKRWWDVWERWKEGEESDWWFASTGIPLLAATLGPLANVSSIAALVTSWRQTNFVDGQWLSDFQGVPYADPRWCYWINVVSLICGFLGNIFLLLNFTQRVRYIVALPATIIFWYLSSGFLIAITVCINTYTPPMRPEEGYTQGFWYAIAAAVFYTVCSILLMVNMLGYFLGHYGEEFKLSDSQRTLILQTMAFFIWLAGGAAVFARLERNDGEVWGFSDALYYCDVTILTVGFGDLVPTSDVTRGIAFPYSVFGIIVLALIVSSLFKAVRELGEEKVVQKHTDRLRSRTVQRIVTNSFDLRHNQTQDHTVLRSRSKLMISAPSALRRYRTPVGDSKLRISNSPLPLNILSRKRTPKLLLLKEEKDRFEVMRRIQASSSKFKRWIALFWSVTTFSLLWCIGAVIFWQAEKETQHMTYFQALYFCYISLLTIGYGDLAPKSNAGRCFFVVWSLIAVPTMTILVGDLGDTIVAKFRRAWDGVADFTVLPREGVYHNFLPSSSSSYPLAKLNHHLSSRAARRRVKKGFETSDLASDMNNTDLTLSPILPTLATEAEQDASHTPSRATLARQIAHCIQTVASDVSIPTKRYEYEEWVEFTRLVRLSARVGCRGCCQRGGEDEEIDADTDVNSEHAAGQRGGEDRNGKRRPGSTTTAGEADARTDANAETQPGWNANTKSNTNDEERKMEARKPDPRYEAQHQDQETSLIDWDWIGEESPMMSGMSESAWVLERLCESLSRVCCGCDCSCALELRER